MTQQSHSWAHIQKTLLRKDTCTPNVHSSTIYKSQDMEATEEWIKKMWYIYTMEYYSAMTKNKIMPFAATWMDLKIIILSEVSQRKTNII